VLLLLQFKDRDGRVFSERTEMPLSASPATSTGGAAPSFGPILLGVLAVAVAGIIIWSWKKKR
jgi:LPXTG-motif cell wall-anchored protein